MAADAAGQSTAPIGTPRAAVDGAAAGRDRRRRGDARPRRRCRRRAARRIAPALRRGAAQPLATPR